jgi:hypothetical protein
LLTGELRHAAMASLTSSTARMRVDELWVWACGSAALLAAGVL